jgi:hypothetical protein
MRISIFLVPVILLVLSSSARGVDRLVPSEYSTIQAAINAADNNDIVIIADGTYTGAGNRDIHFLGRSITVKSANGPGSCVVDCNNAGIGFYFDNNETPASVLDGIAIRNTYDYAILTVNSSPTISNCVFTAITGINCSGGAPSIIGCTLEQCWTYLGSIALTDCNGAHITDCSITYSSGIHGINSTADINRCVVIYNSGAGYLGRDVYGGGIYWEGGNATIQNCDISNNYAHGQDSPPDPGMMCPPGCDPGCIIPDDPPGCMPCTEPCPPEPAGNGAGGGICGISNSYIELINCLIIENQASGGMGGMAPGGGGSGGGVYCDVGTTLIIRNCTISNNSAIEGPGCGMCSSGGGLYKDYYTGGGTATIENSIIWNNYSSSGSEPEIGGNASGITVTYSDVGPEGWAGNMNDDPLFATGPLGDYYLSNTGAGQSYNSPCINMGDNPSSTDGLDLRTTSTDNFPDNGTVDMGYHYEISEEPNLILLDPNGGETFIAGRQHTVRWASAGAVRDVKIEYSTNDGTGWQEVNPANYGDTGSYNWTLPSVDSNQCLVRIKDRNFATATDTTDTSFTIFRCLLQGDVTGDCHVNFEDFAVMSNEWLECGNPFDADWCTK